MNNIKGISLKIVYLHIVTIFYVNSEKINKSVSVKFIFVVNEWDGDITK